MRASRAPYVVFLIILGACVGSRNAAPEAPAPASAGAAAPQDVPAAIRAAVEQYRQAYEVRALDALAPLYAKTLDVFLVHQGEREMGWTAVQAYLAQLLTGASEIRVRIDDLTITAMGPDAAIVSGTMWRTISDGVTTVDERGVLSLAFHRQDGAWIIVAEHFSYSPRTL